MAPLTYLVLGAAGFIGRHVCRELAKRGITVLGLGHGDWTADDQHAWGLSAWMGGDVTLDNLTSIVAGRDIGAILHCAGSGAVSHSYSRPHDDFQRTVTSSLEVLEFARLRDPPPRVVIASSAAVYGDQGNVDLAETATRSPMSPYGYHKLMVEQTCDSYARFFSVPVSVVRLFSVYGEGLRKQLLWDASRKFQSGAPNFFGTGHELRDWIHAEDAATLLVAAACGNQSNFEFYNGGGHKATTQHVLALLARQLGTKAMPIFTGLTHTGNPHRLTADWGHARRQLGWKPTVSLEEGIARYAKWFVALSN